MRLSAAESALHGPEPNHITRLYPMSRSVALVRADRLTAKKKKKCAHRQTQVCCAPQSYNHSLCAFLNSIRCGVRRSGPAAKHGRMILILVLLPAPLVTFTLSKLKLSTTESDRGVLGYINVTNSQCSFIWVCPANLSMKSCQSVCQLEVRASEQIRDENTVSS